MFGGAENAVPPAASPALFDRYVTQYGKPLNDVLHAHGCTPLLHCHGRVGQVLDRFWQMGYVGTHPAESPPMGDITPAEFKDRVGGRLAMIGNVQIGDLIDGEPGCIRAWVRDLIDAMGTAGGLVVSESVAPWTTPMTDRTLQNYIALIEAVYMYGRSS